MLKLRTSALQSRVARRIFGVFLFCAIVPFVGLVLVSESHIDRYLNEKNRTQLRAMAKIFGMDIFERLTLLEASLENIASFVDSKNGIAAPTVIKTLSSNPQIRWTAVTLLTAAGQRQPILGTMLSPPALTPAQKKRLASGKAALLVVPSAADSQPRLLMAMAINPLMPDHDLLIGEIDNRYLWNITASRALPSQIKPCVVSQFGEALRCAASESRVMPADFTKAIAHSATGDLEWSKDSETFIGSYWTLPLRYQFDTPEWVVFLRTTSSGLFASIGELQRTLFLWFVVCIGCSVLLASYQIRRQLVPIEKLKLGTEKFAVKDFGFRVQVASGDEFADLANSMNAMAAQLGQQFETLETTAAIDRAVLSLLDTGKIGETILANVIEFLRCERGTMTLVGAAERAAPKSFALETATTNLGIRGNLQAQVEVDAIAAQAIRTNGSAISSGRSVQGNSGGGTPERRQSWLSMPLEVNGQLLCVMIFYAAGEREFSAAEIEFVRAVSSQAAIAIYNSQLFEQTKQQSAELLKANQAKDDFLSVVSHELRTPLNVILGYVRVLKDKILGDLSTEQEKALGTVNRHSVDLLAIVDSIMDATNIQNGTVTAEFQPVDLGVFFDNLRSGCQVPAEKELALDWNYSAALPTLMTDEPKLQTIVRHLVNNAIKFTEAGAVTIAANHLLDGAAIEIKVADTGVGIPADSLQRIFELFEQSDNSKTRQYGGLGLGLYIVKKLTTLLGGRIDVSSQVGAGSVFTLTLPLIPVETSGAPAHQPPDNVVTAGLAQDL